MNKIFLKSCERMDELPDGSIALTVTSPPYWNAIDYDVHTKSKGANYRYRQNVPYEEYLGFLRRCFTEVKRVTKDGGYLAIVVGTVLLNGKHTPLPFHLVGLLEEIGWEFHQDIIWHKCTAGVKRAGSVIQKPYPGYYYPNIMTEYILIFRKPGESKIYNAISTERKEESKIQIDSVFTMDTANNVWHIAPVPPGQYNHPCPFPEEIPYRLITLYSYKGDTVLDPFVGVGTTLKVAHNLGRRWIGYEIIEEYVEESYRRINQPLRLRKQLIVSFDKISHGVKIPAKNPPRTPFTRPWRKKRQKGLEPIRLF
ncbi:MAG: site-specific DNA-methyltransferase [Armatimonadota bacterium]|nr:site-specific DNA-methyltransferase [Armatimonadota bacterium]